MQSTTFTVDAALLQELGDRLIGRSYIALAELVKNAYDADAIDCRIEFADDRIIVSDNGHGMSEEEFHRHWMRIGTTHKTGAKVSRRLRRAMTGSKGIGRLSVQFLAGEMTLESTSADAPSRHLYAFIDWKNVRHGADLDTVDVLWETRPGRPAYPHDRRTGTRIVLRKLRFRWNADEIERLGREVWMLQSPFRRSDLHSEAGTARDFYVHLDAPGIETARTAFLKLQDALFENWKARISGQIEDGRSDAASTVTVEFKEGYPEGLEAAESFREIVAVPIAAATDRPESTRIASPAVVDRARFEILIFKPEGRQVGGIPVAEMREYLRKFGNVSVYDAGFRLPYYGSDHDWLNVAVDQGRRLVKSELLPSRLHVDARYLLDLPAPGRILGTLEIDTNHERSVAQEIKQRSVAPKNDDRLEYLQIQPGRDRLADNAAFEQLRNLVRFSLDFYANRFKLLSLRASEKRRAKERPSRTCARAIAALDRNESEIPRLAFQEVRREIVAVGKAVEREEQHLDLRAALLAPLATAGMTALALNHELAREIMLFQQVSDRLRAMAASSRLTRLATLADDIAAAADRVAALRQLFDPLLSAEDRAATDRLRVRAVLQQVVRGVGSLMRRVDFQTRGVPDDLRFPLGSFAEWSAMIQNVLTNAWNAMLDSERAAVVFEGGRGKRGREWLSVSDTGVGLGVSLEESDTLFEPFERRLSISAANRSIAMGGQGLGLAIVRMIAGRRGAQVAFVTPRPGFATTFEVSWRGAQK